MDETTKQPVEEKPAEQPVTNAETTTSQVNQEALAKAQEFIDPLMVIVKYAVQKSHTDIDDEVIKQLQEGLAKIDLSTPPPTEEEVAEASFTLLTELTELTKTEADDKLVAFARSIYDLIVGQSGLQSWIEKIKATFKRNAEKRKIRRAAIKAKRELKKQG